MLTSQQLSCITLSAVWCPAVQLLCSSSSSCLTHVRKTHLTHLLQDDFHVLLEAHVQHLVSLIQHNKADLLHIHIQRCVSLACCLPSLPHVSTHVPPNNSSQDTAKPVSSSVSSASNATTHCAQPPGLSASLANLLSAPHAPASSIAAWAAGCCLCVHLPPPPHTHTQAAHTLSPISLFLSSRSITRPGVPTTTSTPRLKASICGRDRSNGAATRHNNGAAKKLNDSTKQVWHYRSTCSGCGTAAASAQGSSVGRLHCCCSIFISPLK